MYKVAINNGYGGFRLSFQAVSYIFDNMSQEEKHEMKKDFKKEDASDSWSIKDHIAFEIGNLPRHHRLLVEAVEKFGKDAGSFYCNPIVVEIKGDRYMIKEYDGWESVVEPEDISWIKIE